MAVAKQKIKKIIKMGDLLCASYTLEEAYGVIGREMSTLFPAGAFYRYDAAKNLLDAAATWGDTTGGVVLAPEDCFAVRRNRPHLVAGPAGNLPCPHAAEEKTDRASLCVPLRVYGEFIGLLHVRLPFHSADKPRMSSRNLDAGEQSALLAAHLIGLTVRNLQFREQMSYMTTRDSLTGLINRRHLEDVLAREIKKANREGSPLGLIFMDIDHVGHINQTYGLGMGEKVIRDLGLFLGEHFQGRDVAGRWGADEFVVILPGSSLEDLRRRAEGLREILKDYASYETHRDMRRVTLSIGVAASPVHGETADDLLQSARAAVRRAKKEGRDRVCVAD